ncbi:MAG: N-acetyl-gamma-glutamyl-phosphate reductase, partial [Chloroflexi bacterium]|nr:N-acetyl-gamma-glutamyl-phosphate reductase [Chloroflexota bacterium]
MKVGIINVTGYAGVELARLLRRHPEAELVSITGRSEAGKKLGEVFPHLDAIDLTITAEVDKSVDIVFSALPQVASAEAVVPLIRDGIKVVDISADFRLKDAQVYEKWYKAVHPAPDLLEDSVYGLTELNRKDVASATLVANPGCYPTGALLALAPLVKRGLIEHDIVIDSKSGVSGGGRSLVLTNHYSEVNENVQAYGLDGHRHLPEITQELEGMSGVKDFRITFVPHLIPMTRGIFTTCYAWPMNGSIPSGKKGQQELLDLFRDFYKGEPFVKVASAPAQTKQTWGNNDCIIYPAIDKYNGRLVLTSCIDNLVKGAAGQAVQNMNLMFGLPEKAGLDYPA